MVKKANAVRHNFYRKDCLISIRVQYCFHAFSINRMKPLHAVLAAFQLAKKSSKDFFDKLKTRDCFSQSRVLLEKNDVLHKKFKYDLIV